MPPNAAARPPEQIIDILERSIPLLQGKQILAGFDGFIDTIVKPVRKFGTDGKFEYFDTIAGFGTFIGEHSHKSTSIQYDIQRKKAGGNMPNFVLALDALSLPVTAIGMLSTETGETDTIFKELGKQRYSYLPAGTAMALEFEDGKIFLSPANVPGVSRNKEIFSRIENVFPDFSDAAASADLIAFLNWSELPFAQDLWEDIFIHALNSAAADKTRFVFFDLCDTSAKSPSEIKAVFRLIDKIGERRGTILSMNKNEALDAAGKISGKSRAAGSAGAVTESARLLFGSLSVDELIVHQHTGSIALSAKEGMETDECVFNKTPNISTGAGDHFNAAYGFATLAGLPIAEKLLFANSYSGAYIAGGSSPSLEELRYFSKRRNNSGSVT